jgi:hypothetical protein
MKINMKEINAAITRNFERLDGDEWDTLVVPKSWNIESMELAETTSDGHHGEFYGQEIRIWKVIVKNAKRVKKYKDNIFFLTVYEYTDSGEACALYDGSRWAD